MEVTNPRFFRGNISGLGMQKDENGRAVDTRYGVRIDYTDGCLIRHPLDEITIAYAMDGMLEDGSGDRVRGLYLFSPDMAAHIITELTSVLLRADPAAAVSLVGRLTGMIAPPAPVEPDPEPDEAARPAPQDTLVMPAGAMDDAPAAA